MSKRWCNLNSECVELIRHVKHYDECIEFEKSIGVKCDKTPIIKNIEKQIEKINDLLKLEV